MITNERILAEIRARKQNGLHEATETEWPEALRPPLERVREPVSSELVDAMAAELRPNFSFSGEGQEIQFQGFEWHYDGASFPDALGYYGASVEPEPDASAVPVGSNTHKVRVDFATGAELSRYICSDCGQIDVNLVFRPLHEVTCREGKHFVELGDQHDEALDLMESLYTLRLFEVVHLAMDRLVKAGRIDYSNMKVPFYIFANNHDWSPFLVYVIGSSERSN